MAQRPWVDGLPMQRPSGWPRGRSPGCLPPRWSQTFPPAAGRGLSGGWATECPYIPRCKRHRCWAYRSLIQGKSGGCRRGGYLPAPKGEAPSGAPHVAHEQLVQQCGGGYWVLGGHDGHACPDFSGRKLGHRAGQRIQAKGLPPKTTPPPRAGTRKEPETPPPDKPVPIYFCLGGSMRVGAARAARERRFVWWGAHGAL